MMMKNYVSNNLNNALLVRFLFLDLIMVII